MVRPGIDQSQSITSEFGNCNQEIEEQSQSERRGELAVALAINSVEGQIPNADAVPLFVGDQQGIGALIVATSSDAENNHQRRHLMIPRTAAKALQTEDLEYLKVKGCFSLPNAEVCNALVGGYFKFVHPLFPIIDAHEFLDRYSKYGVQQINLLLLWSMFSVSAGYVEDHVLANAGYGTRKAFKEDIVKRAKLLFDLSCENDKIVLIESALLLGFWFADAEDVKQSWYWTGIAIGISQTIGLHRDPDVTRKNIALSDQQRRLWRNLWWGCFLRDSWLAFGMGRPVRIDPKDCNCPMPTTADVEINIKGIIIMGIDVYAPDVAEFANLWLEFLTVSTGLNRLLTLRYRSHLERPPFSQIDALRTELAPRFEVTETIATENVPLTVATHQLQLHKRVAQIALFRPDTDSYATERVKEASGGINVILERSMADGTAVYTAPATVSLIVPAMVAHLKAAESKVRLTSQLGTYRLELCLMFLIALEDNYPAAGIIHQLFLAVKETKGKKNDKSSAMQDSMPQSSNHYSPNATEVSNNETPPSIRPGESAFALLPGQDQLFDMATADFTDP